MARVPLLSGSRAVGFGQDYDSLNLWKSHAVKYCTIVAVAVAAILIGILAVGGWSWVWWW